MYYHNKILLTYSNIDEISSKLNLFFVNLFRLIILAAALPMVVYGSHFSASFRDADIK